MNKKNKIDFNVFFKTFWEICVSSFNLLAMNPAYVVILILAALFIKGVVNFLLFNLALGSLLGSGIFLVTLIALIGAIFNFVFDFLTVGALVQSLKQIKKKNEPDYGKILEYLQKNWWEGLMMIKRILIYTKGWILVAAGLLVVILTAFIGVNPALFGGLVATITPLLMIGAIVFLIVQFKPLVGVSLSQYFFFEASEPDEKKAMEKSLEVTKSYIWQTFASLAVFSVLAGMVGAVLNNGLNVFMGMYSLNIMPFYSGYGVVEMISQGLVLALVTAFGFELKSDLEKA